MLAGVALLAILDGTILSATPDLVREVFALAVTVVVGGFIAAVWRSNSKLEKASGPDKGARDKGKAAGASR